MTCRQHTMPFGAQLLATGGARFRLWAPGAEHVVLNVEGGEQRMAGVGGGWFECDHPTAHVGCCYHFRLANGLRVPDPASRFNSDDVHGPSELIDPAAYAWADGAWRGRPWEEAVIYELHVGKFTSEGTFDGVLRHLDYLADLGVTMLEIMPVADFPGRRNWGYDGVLLFAPDAAYGRPEDFKRLIDAAHARGLMVALDVVYNHFGPEGNYLHAYAPDFFNPRHSTPWGAAINFDGDHCRTVRDFFVHNALYWLEEYHLDGLRLDAIHAICDDSSPDIVEEIAAAIRQGPGRERHVHLILENDRNQSHYLGRDPAGQPLQATAQWNDDVHHVLHVLASGEEDGYYADYAERPARGLGRCLAEGFAYQGEASAFRSGERRGEPSAHLPPTAFINFLQTHDQIGNRAFGERLCHLADPQAMRAVSAVLLLLPAIPFLFMGEEFAAAQPFLFFCDFGPELAKAVTEGRRREFAGFARFADPAIREQIPDPGDAATFAASVLDWTAPERELHRETLEWHRYLLALRKQWIMPRLAGMGNGDPKVTLVSDTALGVLWHLGDGSRLQLAANLGALPVSFEKIRELTRGLRLYVTPGLDDRGLTRGDFPAWAVSWYLQTDD